MSQRIRRFTPPSFAWVGTQDDPDYRRDLGYRLILENEQYVEQGGPDFSALWEWFHHDERLTKIWLARLRCRECHGGEPVAVVALVRSADRAEVEPVAVVHYQQRRRDDTSAEVVAFRAVLHNPQNSSDCRHGLLLAHADDPPPLTYCRAHGELPVRWSQVLDIIDDAGGWSTRRVARTRKLLLR